MSKSQKLALNITLGGLFAALYFISSNIIPPIYLIPGVPITFQTMIVALMAGLLGTKLASVILLTIYMMTLAGVPMASGFIGGPAAFMRPSTGYMLGMFLLILAVGLYRDKLSGKVRRRSHGAVLHAVCSTSAGIIGMIFCYACAGMWMTFFNGTGLAGFPACFSMNIVFLPLDCIKMFLAYALALVVQKALSKAGFSLYMSKKVRG